MRIAVEHRTLYRFTEPQARVVQLLRMRPLDTENQVVVAWRIDVDCDATLHKAEDGFGNETTMLYAPGPLETLEVCAMGEVLTLEWDGIVRAAAEPLPPMYFLRTTQRTLPGDALTEFAQQTGAGAGEPLERAERLSAALHARFDTTTAMRDRGTTVQEAFARERVSVRDLAQMLVAGARTLELPARYVSGYRQSGGAECAPHAWAEVHVEGLGWVSLDPSTGGRANDCYVRLAAALDATGAALISGHRVGAGEEELDVDVHVDRLGGDA